MSGLLREASPACRVPGPEQFSWGFALGAVTVLALGMVVLAVVLMVTVREHQGDDSQDTPP